MPWLRHRPYWQALIVTVMMVAGGAAQAQTGGELDNTAEASGATDRLDPGSRWGRSLELSEGGLALSKNPTKGESFVVIRDASGSPVSGPEASVDYRMSLGVRGIWPTGSGLNASEPGTPTSAEDDEKIIYYTMRYDGIQFGLSYFPGLGRGTDPLADAAAQFSNSGMAFGANYDGRFEDFGFGLSAGYTSTDAFADVALPDMDAWTVGARFDVGGLRLSGGIQLGGDSRNDPQPLTAAVWDEAWNLGARYRWGRNDVSLAYLYGENRADLKAPGDDKLDAATLSYVRELDRGVKWSVNLLWADHDRNTAGHSADNDGTALSTAIRLSF